METITYVLLRVLEFAIGSIVAMGIPMIFSYVGYNLRTKLLETNVSETLADYTPAVLGLIGIAISFCLLSCAAPYVDGWVDGFHPQKEINSTIDSTSSAIVETQGNAISNGVLDIPDGYKFVDMDDEGRYYIIEDAEGNQQVIIIGGTEK